MLEKCAEDEEDSKDTEDTENSGPEAGTSPSEGEESVPSSARLRLEGVEEQLRNKLQAQVGQIFLDNFYKMFLPGRAAEVAAAGQPRAAEHLRGDPRTGGREDGAGAAHRADRGLDTAPGQVGAVATIFIHNVYFLD